VTLVLQVDLQKLSDVYLAKLVHTITLQILALLGEDRVLAKHFVKIIMSQ
jgi:hypothetical protein